MKLPFFLVHFDNKEQENRPYYSYTRDRLIYPVFLSHSYFFSLLSFFIQS
jgi:hypothetical protein